MKTLSTFDAIKTMCFSGDDVRITDESGNRIDVDAKLEEYLYDDPGRWVINNSNKIIDTKEKRQGRVFALSAYSVDETGRCTGRAMHATMARVTVADIFYPTLISAFQELDTKQ